MKKLIALISIIIAVAVNGLNEYAVFTAIMIFGAIYTVYCLEGK